MCSGRDARAPANACSELRRRASLPCRPCVQVVGSILWTVEEGQEVAKGAEVGGESSGEGGVPLGGRQCWWVNRCKVGHSPGQGPAIRVQGRMQGGVPTCAHGGAAPPRGGPGGGEGGWGGRARDGGGSGGGGGPSLRASPPPPPRFPTGWLLCVWRQHHRAPVPERRGRLGRRPCAEQVGGPAPITRLPPGCHPA